MEKLIVFALILLGSVSDSWANYCEKSPIYQKLKNKCPRKIIHLTFDDGPDPKTTPLILKALNDKDVKSTFYISTTHLKPGATNDLLKDMIKTGHVVGSHGHLHNAHDLRLIKTENGYKSDPHMFTAIESERDIQKSLELLDRATDGLASKQKHQLFRFPYGRGASPSPLELEAIKRFGSSTKISEKDLIGLKNIQRYSENLKTYRADGSDALMRLYERGLDHVAWNFDSEDSVTQNVRSANANPNWYAERILTRMCQDPQKALIALFHDYNKAFNAKAFPDILEIGKCLGLKFVSYDEILKEREYLKKVGALQEAPRLESNEFKNIISLLTQKVEAGDLENACENKANQCYSEYTKKFYSQCEGISSICLDGKWYSKEDPLVKEICQ